MVIHFLSTFFFGGGIYRFFFTINLFYSDLLEVFPGVLYLYARGNQNKTTTFQENISFHIGYLSNDWLRITNLF